MKVMKVYELLFGFQMMMNVKETHAHMENV